MRITLARSQCNNGRTCPNINMTDQGTYVLQGYVVPVEVTEAIAPTPGQAVVELPMSLLPELSASTAHLHVTDRGTILAVGRYVTDPDVRAELNVPVGEDAVEVPAASMPMLEGSS